MKNYIKNINLIILSFTLVVFTSCDIDDVKPINQLVTEKVIKDETSASNALRGVYSSYQNFGVGFFPLHLAAYGNEGRISGFLSGMSGFNQNSVPVENRYLSDLYNDHYKIINNANFLIEELEAGKAVGISDTSKNQIIAQAKALRGLAYFNLLRYFGQFYDTTSQYGVVVRTTFATELDADPRNNVQEVYDLILSDLEFAVDNAPEFVNHFVISKTTARGLLAKVNLYLGNYGTSATLAMEVINNFEGYTLEFNYSNVFTNSYTSSEVLFAPSAGSASEDSRMDNVRQTTYSETLRALADMQVGGPADGDLFSGTGYDPRFSYAYSSATAGFNRNAKYPFTSASDKRNTTYYLRLPEVYLIHAEAEARRPGGDLDVALGSLNAIRSRVGVTPKTLSDQATLLEDIRNEKLLELFFENGEPWFDVVRYDALGNLDASTIKASVTSEKQFVLPIPSQVIIGNNNVIQNPDY